MKYYIIAGEASGDLHGANLMRALQQQDPAAEIRFWGGFNMLEAGGTMVCHIRNLAIMGFWEVLTHLKTVLGNIAFCKKDILAFRPDAMIFIDYPGFNLRIAKFTHRQGIKNYYYISPQIWAWKKGRIKKMRRTLDALYYIQPFERRFYNENSFPNALYVGHPLLDEVQRYRQNQPKQSEESKVIALLPGSRKQELKRSLPIMLQVAAQYPDLHFCIAGMTLLGEAQYDKYIAAYKQQGNSNLELLMDDTYGLLARSRAAIVCSGTATLETCLFDVPQVVCYRTSVISAEIARPLIKVKYISLVNLIMDRPVVKELIQEHFTKQELSEEFQRIVFDDAYRATMREGYCAVKHEMGNEGASGRTAAAIVSNLKSMEKKG